MILRRLIGALCITGVVMPGCVAGSSSPVFANMMAPRHRRDARLDVQLTEPNAKKIYPAVKAAAANLQTPQLYDWGDEEIYNAKAVVVCPEATDHEALQCLVELVPEKGGESGRVSLEGDNALKLRAGLELQAQRQGRSRAGTLTSPAYAGCDSGEGKLWCGLGFEELKAKAQP